MTQKFLKYNEIVNIIMADKRNFKPRKRSVTSNKLKEYKKYVRTFELLEKKHKPFTKNTLIVSLPKMLQKKHYTILIKIDRRQKKITKYYNTPENKFSFIQIYDGDDDKHDCYALTKSMDRCKSKIKYIYNDFNHPDFSGNTIYLCTQHTKAILKSDDKKTLPVGFYFEGDN